jgi:hypothetical protein
VSESKTPTPVPVGFYCDHSDEEPGKRTHEGWEWTDEGRVWTHQPTIVSSHANPCEWDEDRRLCPRAVPVYVEDVPALVAERDEARSELERVRKSLEQTDGTLEEYAGAHGRTLYLLKQAEAERDRLRVELEDARVDLKSAEMQRDDYRTAHKTAVAERDAAREQVRRVELVRVWRNEDGKGFVFADDLFATLEGTEAAKS